MSSHDTRSFRAADQAGADHLIEQAGRERVELNSIATRGASFASLIETIGEGALHQPPSTPMA